MADPTPDRPFPEVRWGHTGSLYPRLAIKVAATSVGSAIIRRIVPLDRKLLSRTNGKFSALGPTGAPQMQLTTIGHKSGRRRAQPLYYHREDPSIFVVGSNFGQAQHPAWTANLLADPQCWVTIGETEIPAVATLLTGAEH